MRVKLWLPFIALVSAALLLVVGLVNGRDSAAAGRDQTAADTFVARVYYDQQAELRELARYDIWENNRSAGYVLIALDQYTFDYLAQQGFRLERDGEHTAELHQSPAALPNQVAGIPGYPCYRTVEETFATAADIVAAYPDLATWSDVGDSWEKTAGLGGYDMQVLRLTNANVAGPKPKFFVTAAIHAREYTTAELVTRFAEYLVQNYGSDADATWLLDYHEIHLMLQTNPDGRKQAEGGASWRKNTNANYCSALSSYRGADLNRNFDFQWGCCGGSSSFQCDATYRGPSPASEPEVQAVQNYMLAQFPDQRDAPLDAAAPADASGLYLDVHSYGELVLWPWGFTGDVAPNGPALQTLGRKFAYFNGYEPDQAIGLYPTDGTTDDFAYGELGVAAYTFELGTAFFEACPVFEDTILPDNMSALIYAAKVARTPYLTPAGPDALNVALSAATVAAGDNITLTVVLDDTRFNNQNGTEPTQAIAAAEYYVDVPPWDTAQNPVALPLTAADGSFDSGVEDATAVVATADLTPGKHILYVRGQDAAGNWGAVSAVFLEISACAAPDPVADLAISAVDESTLRLDWTAAAGATAYEVWSAADAPYFDPAGKDCGAPAPYACATTTATSYQATQLGDVGSNYTFLVRAVSDCGAVAAVSGRAGEFDFAITPGE